MNLNRFLLFTFFFLLPAVYHCTAEDKKLPEIKIKPNIWGGASIGDIHQVLNSATRQIWPHAHQERLHSIKVDRSRTGPIVLFRRGTKEEYLVRLDTKGKFWCQYAFQFAHEFGHIICGYKRGNRSNLWFEETLCETVSLFTLQGMTEEWRISPPFPAWETYGKEFAKYAQNRIKKYRWTDNQSLAQWYTQNRDNLEQDPANRVRNVRLAGQLLPFFKEDPSLWGACAFINEDKSDQKRSFSTYLRDWKKNSPVMTYKKFVSQLALKFGIIL